MTATLQAPLPKRRTNYVITPPQHEGEPYVIGDVGTGHYVRLGADAVRVLQLLDGSRTADDIANGLGPPFTSQLVEAVVASFERSGLLDSGSPEQEQERQARSRWRWLPPINVQFTVIDAQHFPALFRRLLSALGSDRLLRVHIGVLLFGLFCTALNAGVLLDEWRSPVRLSTLLLLMASMTISTTIHELAHAAALTASGGVPSRLGVMIFYLSPAMFCDVSDSWRVHDKRRRVRVMLGGVFANLLMAAIAGALVSVVPGGAFRQLIALFVATNVLSAVVNLVPLIKLDGYLALMCHLDEPHLRPRAMTDARHAVGRMLFGVRQDRRQFDRWWSVPYGVLATVLPFLLVAATLNRYLPLFFGFGVFGALLVAGVFVYAISLVCRQFVAGLRWMVRVRPCPVRAVMGSMALVASIVTVLFVPVHNTVTGGYAIEPDGTAHVYVMNIPGQELPVSGAKVKLRTAGALLSTSTGTALTNGSPREKTVPMRNVLPYLDNSTPAKTRMIDLTAVEAHDETHGAAVVSMGREPLGSLIYKRFVQPAWPAFF